MTRPFAALAIEGLKDIRMRLAKTPVTGPRWGASQEELLSMGRQEWERVVSFGGV